MIKIKEVTTKSELKKFVKFPLKLYKNCQNYVPPLTGDEINNFNPKKNLSYTYSETKLWIAYNEEGKVVGRLGGLINFAYNEKTNTNILRFNHFDVIDDFEVSKALFKELLAWGREKQCSDIMGPIGFNDFDHQGFLIEGFDQPGMFITIYNYPYYLEHLAKLGFEKKVDWFEYKIGVPDKLEPRIEKVCAFLERRGIRILELKNKKHLWKYIYKAFDTYNDAFAPLFGTVKLPEKQIEAFVKQYMPLLDLDLVFIVVNDKDDVVGFGVCMPSFAEASKKAKGRLFPFGFIHFLKAIKKSKIMDMYWIAVQPEYQKLGVNALILAQAVKVAKQKGIEFAETGPELEENFAVRSQWNNFDSELIRKRRCFTVNINNLNVK